MATCIIRKCYSACSGHKTLELQLQVVCIYSYPKHCSWMHHTSPWQHWRGHRCLCQWGPGCSWRWSSLFHYTARLKSAQAEGRQYSLQTHRRTQHWYQGSRAVSKQHWCRQNPILHCRCCPTVSCSTSPRSHHWPSVFLLLAAVLHHARLHTDSHK